MAIIVGDIHGCVEKVKTFLSYKPDVEHIALGDYLDSFREPQGRQIEALQLLLESDAVLLWGNHDLHYLDNPPWICPGYQHRNPRPCCDLIRANSDRFLAAYAVDGWLCSHAGVNERLTNGDKLHRIAARLNATLQQWMTDRAKHPMLDIGIGRDGSAPCGGVFWYDFILERGLDLTIPQLFGHTKAKRPLQQEQQYVALDTSHDYKTCWLFDTESTKLIGLALPDRRKRCIDCLMLVDYLNDDGTCTDCGRETR